MAGEGIHMSSTEILYFILPVDLRVHSELGLLAALGLVCFSVSLLFLSMVCLRADLVVGRVHGHAHAVHVDVRAKQSLVDIVLGTLIMITIFSSNSVPTVQLYQYTFI